MKILFVDSSPTMLKKLHLPIAKLIGDKSKCLFLSTGLSSNVDANAEAKSLDEIMNYGKFINANAFFNADSFLASNDIRYACFSGFRIFDAYWINKCKKYSISTVMFQHGLEIDHVFYKPTELIKKVYKILAFILLQIKISANTKSNFFENFSSYIAYIAFGAKPKSTVMNLELCHPDIFFTYSEWYINFWKKKFGFCKTKFVISRACDLEHIDMLEKASLKKNTVCYICQTLVEDGRMAKDAYSKLIKGIIESIPEHMELVFKLHPRSNHNLYEQFHIKLENEMPNTAVYITHYSSIALPVYLHSGNLIFYEIDGHPIPEIFKFMSKYKVNNTYYLKRMIKSLTFANGEKSNKDLRYTNCENFLSTKSKNYPEQIFELFSN